MSRLGSTSGISSSISDAIVNELKKYDFNHLVEESSTVMYLFNTSADGKWLVQKVDTVSEPYMSYATITNNPGTTSYSDARTNYLTLTYGRYDEAF